MDSLKVVVAVAGGRVFIVVVNGLDGVLSST